MLIHPEVKVEGQSHRRKTSSITAGMAEKQILTGNWGYVTAS